MFIDQKFVQEQKPQRGDMFGFGVNLRLPVSLHVTPNGVKRSKSDHSTINISLLAELAGKLLIHESNQPFGITPLSYRSLQKNKENVIL